MKKMYFLLLTIFVSVPCFAQWEQVNNGIINLSQGARLLGSSDTHLFAGTLGGAKMYRTMDNGNNWTEIQPPVTGNVPESGYFFNGKYFSGLSSSMDCVFYTTDNGTSWNSVTEGPQTTVVRGFSSLSGNIFVFTSTKGIYKSSDGGLIWNASNSGLSNLNVIWMETINSKLIAATIGGGIFISTNNGETWVQSNTGIASGNLNAQLVWRMGTNLYYTAQGGGSYLSNNQGTNWSSWTKPSEMGLGVNEIYRNGANLYMEARHFSGATLKDSLYISQNEGVVWTNITENLSASDLNASGITEFFGDVFIAYNLVSPNLGIYRKTTTLGINQNYQSDFLRIYPNPFNEKIILSNYSSKKIKQVSIYNSQGKLVVSEIGNIESMNTLLLNKGFYIIEILFIDNTTVREKLIK